MLEFIRCKPIGSNFIINLAREGFFTASTDKFSGLTRLCASIRCNTEKGFADNETKDWYGKHGRGRSFTHSKSVEAKRHDNHTLVSLHR
jgi:hypothetical protein